MLTETQIDLLLRQKSISDEWPWRTNDQRQIDKHIRSIVAEACRKLQLEEKAVYDHYGSGYASYVDCWLYRPDKEFGVGAGDDYKGLVVLLSRLSPYCVIGQGQKSWHKTGGASYLPIFDFVDGIEHAAVLALVPRVTKILTSHGLKRLHKSDLEESLRKGLRVPTVLAERKFRQFDALFYWED